MRITQGILTNSMLRNLNQSFNRLDAIQNQLATGKKITKPSDDPVVAMRGISFRGDLNNIEQYQRNIAEVNNFLDSTDVALDQATSALQRIRELTVNASNGVYTNDERKSIAAEINQLREQLIDVGNSKVAGKYIFNGTSTTSPPLDKTNPNNPAANINTNPLSIEVFDGVQLQVNANAQGLFGDNSATGGTNLFGDISALIDDLNNAAGTPGNSIDSYLAKLDANINNIVSTRADVGARKNRVELMEERLMTQEVFSTRILSDNEDADLERVITDLTTQESVHRAALGVGARIVQPSLLDFLR
ncbi:flagellar hook-associated protein FlgL [Bacillus pinisoli]|uniref:flagellar hook-associated protein FlgL n=1 Tax=Bacillus pinisoli TaxID=2901866 RepID=UPI001FF4C7ED|nr:flagellar hook-associated protein FlgL [Bacillus pinisoli]